jgi:transcriptional regulator with XRE-family HTH domain
MPPIRGPAVPRRRLGAELRRLREEAGLLIEAVAAALECSTSKISRLENGKGIPKIRDVRDMLDRYGVTDTKVRDRLLQWARDGQQQGWWQEFSDVMQQESLTAHLDTFIALEADAARKFEFQQSVVPGLLQTEAYARAILEVFPYNYSSQHVDRLVELRLRRQGVLHRSEHPLEMMCVIDEAVLLRPVGGHEAMVEQLKKISSEAVRPNITVKILPLATGEHASIIGSFELFEFTDDSDQDIVNVESLTGVAYLESAGDVGRYRRAFGDVASRAEGGAQSIKLIESAVSRFISKKDAVGR